jgi:hypothetical protein
MHSWYHDCRLLLRTENCHDIMDSDKYTYTPSFRTFQEASL